MPLGCDYNTMINLFKTGKAAMIIAGPWTFADFRATKVNFGFTKLPTAKGKIMRPFVGVAGFMVSAHGKNKMSGSEEVRPEAGARRSALRRQRLDRYGFKLVQGQGRGAGKAFLLVEVVDVSLDAARVVVHPPGDLRQQQSLQVEPHGRFKAPDPLRQVSSPSPRSPRPRRRSPSRWHRRGTASLSYTVFFIITIKPPRQRGLYCDGGSNQKFNQSSARPNRKPSKSLVSLLIYLIVIIM